MKDFYKKLTLIVVLFSFMPEAASQVSYNELLRETDYELKVEKGLLLCNIYMRNDIDSIRVLSRYFAQLYRSNKKSIYKFTGQKLDGSYFLRKGELELARKSLNGALNITQYDETEHTVSEIFVEIGNSYFLSGEGRLAIESYLLSMDIGEESQDLTSHYNGMLGLAKVYCSVGDTILGLQFAESFISNALDDDKYEALADGYAFLGMIYFDLGEAYKAKNYYKQSLYYSKMSGSRLHLAHAFNNRAIIDYQSNQLDSSYFYFNKSLGLRKSIGNTKSVVESYFNLGSYFIGIEQVDVGVKYIDSSRVLSNKLGFLQDEIDALEMLDLYSDSNSWSVRIDELRTKLDEQNKVSDGIKSLSAKILGSSRNNRTYISPRKRGEFLPWIIISLIVPFLVLTFLQIQKRLV